MKPVKITVLKKYFDADLAEAYLTDGKNVVCPELEVSDTFLYEGGAKMPDGFCPWAWIDIYRSVSALSSGATYTPRPYAN